MEHKLKEVTRHFGIIIDDRLRSKDHCDYVFQKIGKNKQVS